MEANSQASVEAEAKDVIIRLKEMNANPNWQPNGTDPCEIFKIEIDERIASKGVAVVNFPIEKVIQFLTTPGSLAKVNEMMLKYELLYHDPQDTYRVVYMEYKGTWPVSNRDFVVVSVRHREGDNFYIATKSCSYPYAEKNGVVRAQLYTGGYILEKINENSTRLTYISDSDMKGNIPGMIKNTVSSKQGQVAAKIGPVMQKEGF